MSAEENKTLARRLFEESVGGNLAVMDEVVADDIVDHSAWEGQGPGREGYKQAMAYVFAAFPDARTLVEDQIAEGDKVVTRWTIRATHQGEFLDVPATGKQVTVTGISIHRIACGKIVGEWTNLDMLGLLQQLGAIPQPGRWGANPSKGFTYLG